ncbi:MAG: hypothetical protein J1E42_05485 [Akkermansiaceae bacterium]|nr:hypothetical protein [Akkermansiaceae bacterium]
MKPAYLSLLPLLALSPLSWAQPATAPVKSQTCQETDLFDYYFSGCRELYSRQPQWDAQRRVLYSSSLASNEANRPIYIERISQLSADGTTLTTFSRVFFIGHVGARNHTKVVQKAIAPYVFMTEEPPYEKRALHFQIWKLEPGTDKLLSITDKSYSLPTSSFGSTSVIWQEQDPQELKKEADATNGIFIRDAADSNSGFFLRPDAPNVFTSPDGKYMLSARSTANKASHYEFDVYEKQADGTWVTLPTHPSIISRKASVDFRPENNGITAVFVDPELQLALTHFIPYHANQAEAEVSYRQSTTLPPLIEAAQAGQIDFVRALLQSPLINVWDKDAEGRTADEVASTKEIATLLQQEKQNRKYDNEAVLEHDITIWKQAANGRINYYHRSYAAQSVLRLLNAKLGRISTKVQAGQRPRTDLLRAQVERDAWNLRVNPKEAEQDVRRIITLLSELESAANGQPELRDFMRRLVFQISHTLEIAINSYSPSAEEQTSITRAKEIWDNRLRTSNATAAKLTPEDMALLHAHPGIGFKHSRRPVWNPQERTLFSTSLNFGADGKAVYTEKLRHLSEDGLTLTTLTRSATGGVSGFTYDKEVLQAVGPCLFAKASYSRDQDKIEAIDLEKWSLASGTNELQHIVSMHRDIHDKAKDKDVTTWQRPLTEKELMVRLHEQPMVSVTTSNNPAKDWVQGIAISPDYTLSPDGKHAVYAYKDTHPARSYVFTILTKTDDGWMEEHREHCLRTRYQGLDYFVTNEGIWGVFLDDEYELRIPIFFPFEKETLDVEYELSNPIFFRFEKTRHAVSYRSSAGNSPLVDAAISGEPELVRALLSCPQVDPWQVNAEGVDASMLSTLMQDPTSRRCHVKQLYRPDLDAHDDAITAMVREAQSQRSDRATALEAALSFWQGVEAGDIWYTVPGEVDSTICKLLRMQHRLRMQQWMMKEHDTIALLDLMRSELNILAWETACTSPGEVEQHLARISTALDDLHGRIRELAAQGAATSPNTESEFTAFARSIWQRVRIGFNKILSNMDKEVYQRGRATIESALKDTAP